VKLFTYLGASMTAVVAAYNRGHAVKLLSKLLEAEGHHLLPGEKVEELKIEEVSKRGKVFVLRKHL
jgi:hypothetical protein